MSPFTAVLLAAAVSTGVEVSAEEALDPPTRLGLCEACHGRDGRGRTADTPHIGGQQEAYLRDALLQYRDGRRGAATMTGIAAMLRPADVDALARWYAAQSWRAGDDAASR